MRSDLTPAERTEHTEKRKEVWSRIDESRNQVGQLDPPEIGYKKPPPQEKSFAAATATATGLSKRTINRDLRRAEGICQEARDLIRGGPLDTGTFLDNLLKIEKPEDQVEAVPN